MQTIISSLSGRNRRTLVIVVGTLIACLSYMTSSCDARAVRPRNNRRPRPRAQDNLLEYWLCPQVICAPLPESCERIEYIVYQYEYTGSDGKLVSVRCESCEYCLDMPSASSEPQTAGLASAAGSATGSAASATGDQPSGSSQRTRRSLYDTPAAHVVETNPCPEFEHCPSVPPSCSDARLTMVILNGRQCRRCLACYDNTVFHTDL